MQLKFLGTTGISVSPLGLGTVKLGRNTNVKYPQAFLLPNDKQIENLLLTAQDLGVNLLDTAPAYGNSEERLGKFFTHHSRSNWVIVSKAGEEYINNCSSYNYTPAHLQFSVERSLKRLNTDYLDVLLIHSNGNDEDIINKYEVFATLAKLKQRGWIRAYGMSTKTIAGGILTVQHADVVMCSLNLNYLDELEVIKTANNLNKGVLIKKSLDSGKMHTIDTISQTFNFIFTQPGISAVVVGTINTNNLINNCHLIQKTLI